MPPLPIDTLTDEARVWVFGISPTLDARKAEVLLHHVDQFLDKWAAHQMPILSGRELIEGSFLVIAVEKSSETSGCSIDSMFGTLRKLERDLNVSIIDTSNRIYFRDDDGQVTSVPRSEFTAVGTPATRVFDVLVDRLGDVRSGRWEKPAAQSWHAQLLGATVS